MAQVAFLGLGIMGFPMAGHLKARGHEVRVYNRTGAKAEAWVARHGGTLAATPARAVSGAEFVMACVGNDDDLRQVCLGPEGAFAGMAPGSAASHSTTQPQAWPPAWLVPTRPGSRASQSLAWPSAISSLSGGAAQPPSRPKTPRMAPPMRAAPGPAARQSVAPCSRRD